MSFTPRLIRNICALRVYVGNINAVTGEKMGREVVEERKQGYVVVPGQQWLDGICVQGGVVRQFVAMPRTYAYYISIHLCPFAVVIN
jgi:hypothetical protein